jgi:hypothetical protein
MSHWEEHVWTRKSINGRWHYRLANWHIAYEEDSWNKNGPYVAYETIGHKVHFRARFKTLEEAQTMVARDAMVTELKIVDLEKLP